MPYRTARVALLVAVFLLVLFNVRPAVATCAGDCDGDCTIVVTEIITLVNIGLGNVPTSSCEAGDADGDGEIVVSEILVAVSAALDGCPAGACRRCGNGTAEIGEECDDGGLCVGGANAGRRCHIDAQCDGDGTCEAGTKFGYACVADSDCPGSRCAHCKPFGGDGCASNCTLETDVPCAVVPGIVEGLEIRPGTSGEVIHAEVFTIPLDIRGTQTFTIGKPAADGTVPVVIKAASVAFPTIPVGTLACACLRAASLKTCGGMLFEADGTPSPPCNDDFDGGVTCPASKPCAFAHGPGNSASGSIGCGEQAMPGVDVSLTQDAGGCGNPPDCTRRDSGPVVTTLGGDGPRGSLRLVNTTALDINLGSCPGNYCSDTDPFKRRAQPRTVFLTTGAVSAQSKNVNFGDTVDLGPFAAKGAPLDCARLADTPPGASGVTLVGASLLLNQPTFGDVVVTPQFICR